ncbi:MAG TPA: ferric reductase-like transmembrane domain-containing protein, partial [Acidimicrobiia bacterium]|nr:ferric reductase-like transmembrane domain-containing protein [Acidimicrobiia bacterium]
MLALTSPALWYFTRGTGVVSLVLLTASVALGVSEVVRFASARWPRFVVAALHRNVSLLATAFVAAHVLTALVDSYAPIRLADLFVPFGATYRPLWLGLGAVAFDLLIALTITSLLRGRVGYRTWRIVHWAAYACWPVAFLHGLGTGSDPRYRWAAAVNIGCVVIVLGAVLFRLGWTRTVAFGTRAMAASASVTLAVGVIAWMITDPMRPGWARKAGTPSALLASAQPGTATILIPFSSAVRGSLHLASNGDAHSRVTIDAALPGASGAQLQVVIDGSPLPDGGVRMESGSVRLGVPGAPDLYQGRITELSGTNINAIARAQNGSRLSLTMALSINDANVVGGTVSAALEGVR